MTPIWTLDELKDVLEIDSPLEGKITGIAIDSRAVKHGDLFIPLRGESHDAHKFVGGALKNGAIATLVDHLDDIPMTPKVLQVEDTYDAMVKMAHHARERTKAHIIGITGSFGKTTTKEMLNLILKDQGPTSASEKSFNNHWGVPISLCRLPQETQFGVFEVGMNHSGEISGLVKILKPTIALITEIAEVHAGNFSGIDEIIDAKCEIFEGMGAEDIAVLNRDSSSYDTQVAKAKAQGISNIITFGKHADSTFKLEDIEGDSISQTVTFTHEGKSYSFLLQTTGEHWAMNALAAIATAFAVGGNIAQACHSLKHFELLGGRGKRYKVPLPSGGEIILIDESYNSNPEALRKALSTLRDLQPVNGGRRIAVLGEMREIGEDTHKIHESFIKDLEENHVDSVYTSGDDIASLFNALPETKKGLHAKDVTPIADQILHDIHPGDIILVKGSRGGGQIPRMQEVVDKLLEGVT